MFKSMIYQEANSIPVLQQGCSMPKKLYSSILFLVPRFTPSVNLNLTVYSCHFKRPLFPPLPMLDTKRRVKLNLPEKSPLLTFKIRVSCSAGKVPWRGVHTLPQTPLIVPQSWKEVLEADLTWNSIRNHCNALEPFGCTSISNVFCLSCTCSFPGGYKIAPRACEVSGVQGTCMFVWECLKTEGQVGQTETA